MTVAQIFGNWRWSMHTNCAEIHLCFFFLTLLIFFLTCIFKDLDCFFFFLFEVLINLGVFFCFLVVFLVLPLS